MKKKRKEATFCYLFLLTLLLVYLYVFHSSITTTISSNEEFKSNLWWQSSPLWVEDQRPQVNPHKFGYLINQPELCQSDTEMTLLGGCPKSWSKGISLFSVLEVIHNPVADFFWAWIAPHLRHAFSESWWLVDYYSKVKKVGCQRFFFLKKLPAVYFKKHLEKF